MKDPERFKVLLLGKNPQEVLCRALNYFGAENVAQASSLGAEDQVLTDMLRKILPATAIFTLDTGRLPPETIECLKMTERKYGFKFKVFRPDPVAVKKMVAEKGLDLFYESAENRKLCCQVRKVEPLRRALKGFKAWICGLRREQSVTRADLDFVEWDKANGLYKINPLAHWTKEQVWGYIRTNSVPYNKLHDQGYPSIGCAPCTRAVKPCEDIRAGRWWWEQPEKKECGLHFKDGKVVRNKQ